MRAPLLALLLASLVPAVSTSVALAAPPQPKPAAPAAPPAKAAATAPAPAKAAAALPQLHLDIRKATLPNGLRVVLSVDHTSPTVAVDVMYDVGSRNEERGHSGFAHLFEHMMFQGSKNVPRGEHLTLVSGHGGTLNANTSSDRTNYFELVPQSELPLALWLEADRMKTLDVSQSNLDNQRQVVEEEYRMRVLNAAYVPAGLRIQELIYQGYWPYEHATIGSMPDLDAAQLDWVRAFHAAYYAPNTAVLVISGDFDPEVAMDRVRTWFGDAKAVTPPKYEPGPMPEQTAPREDVVEDAHARFPAVMYGWPIPPDRSPDHYALDVATGILGDGESSRLYSTLVHDRAIAADVNVGTNSVRGPDAFEITIKVSGKGTVAEVDKALTDALAKLAKTPPSEAEMTKVRRRFAHGVLFGLESNYARASELARYELYFGDAGLLNGELDKYLAVPREEISRVVAKYLVPAKRSRVEVKPGAVTPGTPPPPAAAAKPAPTPAKPTKDSK